ncbi:unnamed protein product, partial [Ectocarpus fasciculatus]
MGSSVHVGENTPRGCTLPGEHDRIVYRAVTMTERASRRLCKYMANSLAWYSSTVTSLSRYNCVARYRPGGDGKPDLWLKAT